MCKCSFDSLALYPRLNKWNKFLVAIKYIFSSGIILKSKQMRLRVWFNICISLPFLIFCLCKLYVATTFLFYLWCLIVCRKDVIKWYRIFGWINRIQACLLHYWYIISTEENHYFCWYSNYSEESQEIQSKGFED